MSPKKGSQEEKKLFWKGKRVTKKVYKRRLQQSEIGKNIRSIYGSKALTYRSKDEKNTKHVKIEGRRIIHMQTLAENLKCKSCNSVLSLSDTLSEKRCVLASVFSVKCQNCGIVNPVPTDKKHDVSGGNQNYDVNTKAVTGVINSGDGNTHFNKQLASMDIPRLNWQIFKNHEKEVGKAAEDMAYDSCVKASLEEREFTINNKLEVEKFLPSHLDQSFLFPDTLEKNNILETDTVRVAASFDMGWPTRGTGRTYDSLSGTGTLIGHFSKKVLSYVSLHRQCKMCSIGHNARDHDCRLNFQGSAKSMEPRAAVLLTDANDILKKCNIQVEIFIADNDSSAICAVRNACSHEVVKLSDKNHTSKGVVNELYKIIKNYKELTAESIKYIQKCFNYCVSQNVGNSKRMATAIQNIPNHFFNNHSDCGSWCNYHVEKENYVHKVIGKGFTNLSLLNDLKKIFSSLANKAESFASGASSNSNESTNAMLVSKAPKSRMYGTSAAADIRAACAINKKNNGEKYIDTLFEKLNLSPGKYTKKFNETCDLYANRRYQRSLTRSFKIRRLFLKKRKTELKNKNETSEGISYESDMGLLENNMSLDVVSIDENLEKIVVLFDLETGGLSRNADILQIACKYEVFSFSVYIKPTQKIDEQSSKVTGLECIDGYLCLHGSRVETVTLSEALIGLYDFLCLLKRKCIMTAHNCRFDYPRLVKAIEKTFMDKYFKSIIYGFSDTLPLIKKCTGKTGKGDNKLEEVAKTLNIDTSRVHNALDDVEVLDQVIKKFRISQTTIIELALTWELIEKKNNLPSELEKLNALNECISLSTRKKIIEANISFEMIIEAFETKQFSGLQELFGRNKDNKIMVTCNVSVIKKIYEFLQICCDE